MVKAGVYLMARLAPTLGGTVGAGLILLAVAVLNGNGEIVARAVAAIFFLLLTVPVASHMIGRAAYISALTKRSGVDCLPA